MPINAHTQNEFIQRVYRERRVPMTEVVALFYKNPAKANLNNVRAILNRYTADGVNGEIRIVDHSSGEAVFPRVITAENIENLSVDFNGLAAAEADRVELHPCRVLACDQEDMNEHELALALSDFVQLFGSPENAHRQHKRLLLFANYLGQIIVRRQFDRLSALCWDPEDPAHTPEALAATVEKHEKTEGRFELFVDPKVLVMYFGEGSGKKFFDDMKPPKGARRDQRAGMLQVDLVSEFTPNGIPAWTFTFIAEVMETELGEFRIARMQWMNTY